LREAEQDLSPEQKHRRTRFAAKASVRPEQAARPACRGGRSCSSTQAAARYAIGAIKSKLEQLAALFRQIAERITRTLEEVCRRVKARIDQLLQRERAEAGNYSATPGSSTSRHTQDETQPPREGDRRRRDAPGRCTLRPYRPDTCAPNTGHHVVPDRVFRIGSRGSGQRIPGGPTESQGLVVCVTGANLDASLEHGQIHRAYDGPEAALGAAGTPVGTANLVEVEALAAASVARVLGCNALEIAAQLRLFHQSLGLGPQARVRADPYGRVSRDLDPSQLGTGMQQGGATR